VTVDEPASPAATEEAHVASASDTRVTVQKPRPLPDEASTAFWAGATDGRLVIQQCGACGHHLYPPGIVCRWCLSKDLRPRTMSGEATLYSFAVVSQPFHVGYVEEVPYVIAYVSLDEEPDVRMITRLVGAAPETLQVGMPLVVDFEDRGSYAVPQFRPVGAGS
jgi:uncharacterized OB-fold protein